MTKYTSPRRWPSFPRWRSRRRLLERIVESEELLRQNEKLSALGLLAGEVAHEIETP